MNKSAPLALFIYKRPDHTRETLNALARCPEARGSDLFIFSDGPGSAAEKGAVEKTRAIARSVNGFRSVRLIERDKNLGLAGNIRGGIDDLFADHDRLIVLEDDIEVLPDFLAFMNMALEHYSAAINVFSVTGYLYPVRLDPSFSYDTFLFPRFCCWGWGTWRDRWQRVRWSSPDRRSFFNSRQDFRRFWQASNDLPEIMLDLIDGKNNSWSILFNYTQVLEGGFCVYPTTSHVRNTGFDGTGTHSGLDTKFEVQDLAPAGGIAPSVNIRFSDSYDGKSAEPLRKFFQNRFRRKMMNLARYGHYF